MKPSQTIYTALMCTSGVVLGALGLVYPALRTGGFPPLVWLLLYGQLFKNVTHLGGFGTQSYITFLAPAIVVMNAFFGATWSGMAMIQDLDRDVVERFLTTPVRRSSLVVSQIVRSAITAAIQALIIMAVAYVLGVRSSQGMLGVAVVVLAGVLVNSAFAGMSQGIALLTRKEATMIAVANFIGLPLLFLSSTLLAATQMPAWMQTVAKFNPTIGLIFQLGGLTVGRNSTFNKSNIKIFPRIMAF